MESDFGHTKWALSTICFNTKMADDGHLFFLNCIGLKWRAMQ